MALDMMKNVYFNEYNVLMNNAVYLPLVSGQLQAFAQRNHDIKDYYRFMPFQFIRGSPEEIVSQHKEPGVAAFSISMWNANLSLAVARMIKEKSPDCLTVFGGSHVLFKAEEFFSKNPFVDITVRGEGERTFAQILGRFADAGKRDFRGIRGISYRDESGNIVRNEKEQELEMNLDEFPSPYLDGIFDATMASSNINFQAIIETNRGCPFTCGYCFWGQGGLSKKMRCFGLDRVRETADWCGKNGIGYVFCADSNFGIFKRDLEIAQFFVDAKKRYGFPEKFRVAYAKNSEATVYEIGKLMTMHDMQKGITLSRQTNNPIAAANVNRKNINMDVYVNLQKKYEKEGIPTYTEMIIGLPGETYKSFVDGLEDILQSGLKNQIIVYPCQVYPNTQLGDQEYQKKFGIVTKKIPLQEAHSFERAAELVPEYEDVIVATSSMPIQDWRKSTVVSYALQLFHGMRAGIYPLEYLGKEKGVRYTDFLEHLCFGENQGALLDKEIKKFGEAADSVLDSKSANRIIPGLDSIYWRPEEAAFLDISDDRSRFYGELFEATKKFLLMMHKDFDESQLKDVFDYQEMRMPSYVPIQSKERVFQYNVPEYFDGVFGKDNLLKRMPQTAELIDAKDYGGDKKTFAREVILFGRNSDKLLYSVEFK